MEILFITGLKELLTFFVMDFLLNDDYSYSFYVSFILSLTC